VLQHWAKKMVRIEIRQGCVVRLCPHIPPHAHCSNARYVSQVLILGSSYLQRAGRAEKMKTIGTTERAEVGMSEIAGMSVMVTPSRHHLPTPLFQRSSVHLRAISPASDSLQSQKLFSALALSKICVVHQRFPQHC